MQHMRGDHLAQELSGTQQMLLANNLVERPRTHPIRQRLAERECAVETDFATNRPCAVPFFEKYHSGRVRLRRSDPCRRVVAQVAPGDLASDGLDRSRHHL